MTDIFISYASQDRERIRPLVAALERRGWTVWWDRTILAGRVWEREIEAALAEARCVIVAWSEGSVQSDWVWTEADEGKTRGVLVPVLLDAVTIPLAFRRIHAASLVGWDGRATGSQFEEVARAIAALLGSAEAVTDVEEPDQVEQEEDVSNEEDEELEVAAEATQTVGESSSKREVLGYGAAAVVIAVCAYWYSNSKSQTSAPPVKPTATIRKISLLTPGEIRVNPKDNLRYVWIPAGEFTMGCSPGDSECFDDEKPAHLVKISHGFRLGQTEVTQAAYTAVTGKPNPSLFKGSDDLPVEKVNWEEAKEYCEAVGLRLPTEAEWEYAARAGSTGARYGKVDEVAWYDGNSEKKTHPAAEKSANAWGLYDILGNVWEWVQDDYAPYQKELATDPVATVANAEFKVLRGGCWLNGARYIRGSRRFRGGPPYRVAGVGFRCGGVLR